MRMEVKIKGIKEVKKRLKEYPFRTLKALGKALYEESQVILGESKKQCPVDTGTLRSTGHVDEPKYTRSSVDIQIGYGGASAPYAIYVHERLDLRHKVGKAKFLEDPVKEALPKLPSSISERMKGEFR